MQYRGVMAAAFPALAAVLFFCGCAGPAAVVQAPATDAESCLADAQVLIETLEQTHPIFLDEPYPQAYVTAKEVLLRTVSEDCGEDGFRLAVSEYLNSLNDAHTGVQSASNGLTKRYAQIGCAAQGDNLVLLDEEGRLTGAHITAVGNVTTDAVFSVIDGYFPAENDTARDANHTKLAMNEGILTLAGCAFEKGKIDIMIEENGQTSHKSVGFSGTALLRQNYRANATAVFSKEDGVAVFDLNACKEDASFRTACRKLKSALNDGVTKVIVDVRDNPGGDSNVCKTLLKALGMDVPSYGVVIRYSPLAKEQRGYLKQSGSDVYAPSLDGAKPNGRVALCVLVNDGTFSSAGMLAVWTQDGGLGQIVGYPSANAPSSYGDILSCTLPNTGVSVVISHKQFLRPDENADQTTLVPDVFVPYGEDALPVALTLLNG